MASVTIEQPKGKIRVDQLGPVARTLFIPLVFRAMESRRADAMLRDPCAEEALEQVDWSGIKVSREQFDQVTGIMRMRYFDQQAREFMARQPDGVVISIGCGLDTRFQRVDNGQVRWYDLDLPEVIELRKQLYNPANSRYTQLACSAFEPGWMSQVTADSPVLLLAEGVLMYFPEVEVRGLFSTLGERFPGAEIIFDCLSPLAFMLHQNKPGSREFALLLKWPVKDPREIEGWKSGFKLLSAWNYFAQPEPRLGIARLMKYIPPLRDSAMILHYRLSN